MSKFIELKEEIVRQQKSVTAGTPEFAVGLQILDIAHGHDDICDILITDLRNEKMGLKAVAAKIKAYSDKKHGKSPCFCVTPDMAEQIIRKFYGLPEREPDRILNEGNTEAKEEEKPDGYIDIDSFLI